MFNVTLVVIVGELCFIHCLCDMGSQCHAVFYGMILKLFYWQTNSVEKTSCVCSIY